MSGFKTKGSGIMNIQKNLIEGWRKWMEIP